MNKLWYSDTMEYYVVFKEEFLPLATKWMNLENTVLSVINLIYKKKLFELTHM
jgi:hypothetical protein